MKKKVFLSVSAFALVALMAFAGYKSFAGKTSVASIMLDENIEALTWGEGYGFYQRSVSVCPFPCEYKKSVSCKSGGREECYPSDCC